MSRLGNSHRIVTRGVRVSRAPPKHHFLHLLIFMVYLPYQGRKELVDCRIKRAKKSFSVD